MRESRVSSCTFYSVSQIFSEVENLFEIDVKFGNILLTVGIGRYSTASLDVPKV